MAKLFITLAILCAIGAVVVNAEFDKKEAMATFKQRAEECKKDVGAKDSDLEELVARKPASTMESKCLRACLMKKYDVMDTNGKLVKSVAEHHAETYTGGAADKMKVAHEIIDNCAAIKVSDDHCHAAEEYGKCFKIQGTAHGVTDDFEF